MLNKNKLNIAVSAGHNVYNNGYFDNGSSFGRLKEAKITKKTVKILIRLLSDMGHNVKDVTPYNQRFSHSKAAHQSRANKVNSGNYDLYLDVHINAGGGTGSEVLLNARNNISYKIGRDMTKAISNKTGLRNRGIKNKPSFWSISMVRCPAIIVEGGFIDSPNGQDMKTLTPKLYAESIASVFGTVGDNKEDKYMVVKRDYSIDGKDYRYNSINVDGTVYAPVREISENLGFTVGNKGSKALINPRQTNARVDGKDVVVETVKVNKDTNYIKLEELVKLGIIETDWVNKQVVIRRVK